MATRDSRKNLYQRYAGALQQHLSPVFQSASVTEALTVERVDRDSLGNALTAHGPIGGEGDFAVPMGGKEAAPGDILAVRRSVDSPVGANYEYVNHLSSDIAGAGMMRSIDYGLLPAPEFATPAYYTALHGNPGSITSDLTIRFIAVEEKYRPSSYLIQYALNSAPTVWFSDPANHPFNGGGTIIEQKLSRSFGPGEAVNVKLTTVYTYANNVEADESETITAFTAQDDATPGTATGLTVENYIQGGLNIFVQGTFDSVHFDHMQYEFATSSTGPLIATRQGQSPYLYTNVTGNYYIAARPVSKSGVLGTRFPGTPGTFAGPYNLINPTQPADTTPPPDWTAPTLSLVRAVDSINGETAKLTITLPTYSYPSDYKRTLVYVTSDPGSGAVQLPSQIIPAGVTTPISFNVPFGTTTVRLRGEDNTGNLSTNLSPAASATLQPSGAPQSAPTLTVKPFAVALQLNWTAVPGALTYEIQRAPDVSGAPGTWAVINTVAALGYIDTLNDGTQVQPKFWYTVRALNALGNGPFSAGVSGTMGKIDARNLLANSITANEIGGDVAIFNKVVGNVSILSQLIQTAASGNRVELRGNAAAEPTQIRLVELVPGVGEYVRARVTGQGVFVYADAGYGDISMSRNSAGRAEFMAGNGNFIANSSEVRLRSDLVPINFWIGGSNQISIQSDTYYSYGQRPLYFKSNFGGDPNNPMVAIQNIANNYRLGISQMGLQGYTYGDGVQPVSWSWSGAAVGGYGRGWTSDGFISASGTIRSGGAAPFETYYNTPRFTGYMGNVPASANYYGPQSFFQTGFTTPGNNLAMNLWPRQGPSPDSAWADARFEFFTQVDVAKGLGTLQIGARANQAFVGLTAGGTTMFYIDETGAHSPGALTKPTGSFVIPHPDPAKTDRWDLRHCFVEGPTRGENIYTYIVTVSEDGTVDVVESEGKQVDSTAVGKDRKGHYVDIPLPDYWPYLNERPRVVCSLDEGSDGWGMAKGGVNETLDIMRIRWNEAGKYIVVLYGTRKDENAHNWWDRRGVQKTKAQGWVERSTYAKLEARQMRRNKAA